MIDVFFSVSFMFIPLVVTFTRLNAQLMYSVTDLNTLPFY
ncbi:hypothetical protein PRUB_a3773 [Pseudoalteromonas rubra]|uniref:Uncharacterized protein n=1 Tax=Pseudoalteromonas rubra TaxID=43658 RepID=A0A8T0C996_9GAMM|nr:hypothetical protein PRUB_a3773 [Pseudoalteromonas rubra]